MAHQPFHIQDEFRCPKCGYRQRKVSYCKGKVTYKTVANSSVAEKQPVYSCPEEEEGEHMHETCSQCGYVQLRGVNPEGHSMR